MEYLVCLSDGLYRVKSKKETCKTLTKGAVVIILLHFLIRFEQVREHGDFASLNIPDYDASLPPLPPEIMEDFPTTGIDKIPKIIHQTWKSTAVPQMFVPWVKTWMKRNPDWEYWFWTDEATRKFIADKYPDFLPTFDGYSQPIRRADAMRYFILYEYGGVYADLDVESIQSFSPIIKKYSCFLGQEPFVHSVLDTNFEHLVINAVMGCRKGHPFMKSLVEKLPLFSHMWHVLDSTGPHFVTLWYREYEKHHYPPDHVNGTYLAPAHYFFPTFDPAKSFHFHSQCANFQNLNQMGKRACIHLKKTSLHPYDMKNSFANHHWVHTYSLMFRLPLKGPEDIRDLVPGVKVL
ncbi:hypothetical protein LOTGIDRAFT_234732 [Lottia gigantea]|uniref:Alpha-1,4-N-acetylglucosaminyltransferase n=1 Tax=Lottia gigantea TaxID=225164 RepID=V3ZZU1_LOTGI|nr:hypothetical protein LOTGIDRAFT_234732 [Lottia gigantea]ESO88190.1 hypothetical protein LOTGIDRAFT_234732 [Lottia gigantea]